MGILTIIKYLFRFVYLITKTSFEGFRFGRGDSVVWIRITGIKYFFLDEFVNALALINSLSTRGEKFNIYFGKSIGRYYGTRIFFPYSKHYNVFNFNNYTNSLIYVCEQLEEQGCSVYPKSNEVIYWENKGYMHQQFESLGVPCPKTYLLTSLDEIDKIQIQYPLLLKEEHSFSSLGLYKINDRKELEVIANREFFNRNKYLIIQQLMNMRRDLRVIFVGDKIVHYYWRINQSDEWRPTATSYGNNVDFVFFPDHWRQFLIDQFLKLNLTTGAFDVAWENDDLTQTPMILEVSPYFQPNPAVDLKKIGMTYGEYKKRFLLTASYDQKYVDIVFRIVQQQISYLER